MNSKFEHSVVIGTGYSTSLLDLEKHKAALVGKKVIAFQASFPLAYEMYDIFPDAWIWSDPHSALRGLEFLIEPDNKDLLVGKDLHIYIPKHLGTSMGLTHEYKKYTGTSPVWRDQKMFKQYYSLLEEVKKNKYITFVEVDCYTTKQMKTSPDKTKDCKNIFNNPVERFILSKPVLGSFEYKTDNSFQDVWGRENKLTSFVFPMMSYLRCKELGVIGFDFGGSRFYDTNSKTHAFDNTSNKLEDPVFKIVKTWTKEWYKYHNMKVYSIAKKGESGLVEILQE